MISYIGKTSVKSSTGPFKVDHQIVQHNYNLFSMSELGSGFIIASPHFARPNFPKNCIIKLKLYMQLLQ